MEGSRVPVVILADANLRRRSALRHLLNGLITLLDCSTITELVALSRDRHPHAIVLGSLTDIRSSPLEPVLHLAPKSRPNVVFLADENSDDQATGALQVGIRHFLRNPVCLEGVARIVAGMLPPHVGSDFDGLVGDSEVMQSVKDLIRRLAKTEATVLITGETGTGKELVASALHRNGTHPNAPMITVNCAAIPDSLVESELFGFEKGAFTGAVMSQKGKLALAHGGTIFLDEIGDMSPLAQAKILRALESGEIQPLGAKAPVSVDVRVIAATHQDVEALIADGKFRPDLYFRLNVTRIHIPPLRERLEDLPKLVEHIVNQLNVKYTRSVSGPTTEALKALRNHNWRGNVRELRNVLESAFWMSASGRIESYHLPRFHEIGSASLPMRYKARSEALPMRRSTSERDDLVRALEATHWNKSQTAEILRWSRMTVYRKIDQYRLTSASASAAAGSDT